MTATVLCLCAGAVALWFFWRRPQHASLAREAVLSSQDLAARRIARLAATPNDSLLAGTTTPPPPPQQQQQPLSPKPEASESSAATAVSFQTVVFESEAPPAAPETRPLQTLEQALAWQPHWDGFNVAAEPRRVRTGDRKRRRFVCDVMRGWWVTPAG